MSTTPQRTTLMRNAGYNDVRVMDQPRSSASANDHPNPTIGQPDRPVGGP